MKYLNFCFWASTFWMKNKLKMHQVWHTSFCMTILTRKLNKITLQKLLYKNLCINLMYLFSSSNSSFVFHSKTRQSEAKVLINMINHGRLVCFNVTNNIYFIIKQKGRHPQCYKKYLFLCWQSPTVGLFMVQLLQTIWFVQGQVKEAKILVRWWMNLCNNLMIYLSPY